MKKKLYVLFFIFCSVSVCYSQKSINDFEKGVAVLVVDKKESFDKPKSILFEFSGDTHLINHYLDLSKKIKKVFKKSGIKTKFNYNLKGVNPLKEDLKSIPQKKYNKDKYDLLCEYSIKNFKGWDNHLIKKRKQNHKAILTFKKDENVLLESILDINTFYTISTENKNVAKSIFKLFD